MYSYIAANKRRTWMLMASVVVIIIALGVSYDATLGRGAGYGGLAFALLLSGGLTLTSYYAGDRIALTTSGARPITKRDAPELYRVVENLAIASGVTMPKVYVIPDPTINAFATGRDYAHASIAVTSGALERLEREELEGVVAHELSHIQNFDIRLMTAVVVLVGVIALLSDWILRARWYGGGHRDDRSQGQLGVILSLIGIALAILAPISAELIKLAVSRRREYLADASAALLTRYPEGLARALEKIAAANQPMLRANGATAHLFLANPFGSRRRLLTQLFSTHPPTGDRVRALRAMAV
ncbi:MAG: M48 family metallopeptidase [Candidatus Uhrbacteria bacterium]